MKVLLTCRAVWSTEPITDQKIEVYREVLSRVDFETCMIAVKKHMEHGQFFPRPADILRIIADARTPSVSPGDAWEVVKRLVLRHGARGERDVVFDNPIIERAVKDVGWNRICLDEEKYVRRDFELALGRAHERYVSDVQHGSIAIGERAVDALGSGNE